MMLVQIAPSNSNPPGNSECPIAAVSEQPDVLHGIGHGFSYVGICLNRCHNE